MYRTFPTQLHLDSIADNRPQVAGHMQAITEVSTRDAAQDFPTVGQPHSIGEPRR